MPKTLNEDIYTHTHKKKGISITHMNMNIIFQREETSE